MIKDGKFWAHALEDCVVSARKPICKFWGDYLCGRRTNITNHNNQNYVWEMSSLDFAGVFSLQKKQDQAPSKDHRPVQSVGVHDAPGI